jgi:hypothetical protein
LQQGPGIRKARPACQASHLILNSPLALRARATCCPGHPRLHENRWTSPIFASDPELLAIPLIYFYEIRDYGPRYPNFGARHKNLSTYWRPLLTTAIEFIILVAAVTNLLYLARYICSGATVSSAEKPGGDAVVADPCFCPIPSTRPHCHGLWCPTIIRNSDCIRATRIA